MKVHAVLRTLAIVLVLGIVGTGCPRNLTGGKANVTLLLGGGAKSGVVSLDKAVVDVADIASLTVTVSEITLQPEDENSEEVVLFSGSQDVDLISLSNLSEMLSNAEIPAGTYSQLRLAIDNPRLVLVDDPNTEITDIKLTANGHLFVSETIEIPEGDNLLEVSFSDLHLVRNGNGRYVLTPQLQVDLTVTSADVSLEGVIAEVDVDNDSLVLTLTDGEATVLYGAAAIFLPADTDTATGTEADLVVGATIHVVGTVDLDGVVTATELHILL